MAKALLDAWRDVRLPVVGMLHLPALPGSPGSAGVAGLQETVDQVLRDAEALRRGGVVGLMLENFGDVPFHAVRVEAHVVAAMTRLACEVRRAVDLPLGINVLRNDGRSALAVAAAAGAAFIRVNVLCGARLTDQGVIQGIAADLMRDRAALGAGHVKVLADVNVKHSAPLAEMAIEDEVHDMLARGLADGVVVSGRGTGAAVDLAELRAVKAAAGDAPVWIGSGADAANVASLRPHCDGVIVGTSVKRVGRLGEPVDPDRVRDLVERCHA
jgi:membrane complex biogenesis BtpA family protein